MPILARRFKLCLLSAFINFDTTLETTNITLFIANRPISFCFLLIDTRKPLFSKKLLLLQKSELAQAGDLAGCELFREVPPEYPRLKIAPIGAIRLQTFGSIDANMNFCYFAVAGFSGKKEKERWDATERDIKAVEMVYTEERGRSWKFFYAGHFAWHNGDISRQDNISRSPRRWLRCIAGFGGVGEQKPASQFIGCFEAFEGEIAII